SVLHIVWAAQHRRKRRVIALNPHSTILLHDAQSEFADIASDQSHASKNSEMHLSVMSSDFLVCLPAARPRKAHPAANIPPAAARYRRGLSGRLAALQKA